MPIQNIYYLGKSKRIRRNNNKKIKREKSRNLLSAVVTDLDLTADIMLCMHM